MKRQRRGEQCTCLRRNDSGSSVLEVLVTVLVLTALGAALWSGVTVAVRLAQRTLRSSFEAARVVQLDRFLRRAALRVHSPFWLTGPDVESGPDWLRVAWVDGEPSEGITLERRGDLLILHARRDPPVVFGPFSSPQFSLYADGEGRARGLRVSVAPRSDPEHPVVILAPFGGSTVAAGASR